MLSGTASLYIDGEPLLWDNFSGVVLQFVDQTPPTISILTFPPIVVQNNSGLTSGTFTATDPNLPSDRGTFDPQSGSLTNVLLQLHLHMHLTYLPDGDAGVSFILTTEGSVTSSDGAYTFTGSPVVPTTGAVTLVGKSNIDRDSAYIGGKDTMIAIKGTISPVPSWSQSGGVGQARTQEAARQ